MYQPKRLLGIPDFYVFLKDLLSQEAAHLRVEFVIRSLPSWGKPKKEWRNSDDLTLAAKTAASLSILRGLLSLSF